MRIFITMILGLLLTAAHANGFILSSTAFSNDQKIPVLYTCDGKNISPALTWGPPPPDTQSYVLLFFTPDSPVGIFYNWVLFNIPLDVTSLPEGSNYDMPQGIFIGHNSYDESNYRGPCPYDDNVYHYVFTIYALDTTLDLSNNATIDDVISRMKHHILKQAQIVGTYSH